MTLTRNIFVGKFDDSVTECPLFLFESCNLDCNFCFLKHSILASKENILKSVETIKSVFKEDKFKTLYFKIGGGELFADFIPDDYFKLYEDIILDLQQESDNHNKKCEFFFLSNLVHHNRDRVINFFNNLKFKGCKVHLITSFDFNSRFKTLDNLRIFRENVEFYKDMIEFVSSVITTNFVRCISESSISKQEEKELEVFNWMYNNGLNIQIDYYTTTSKEAATTESLDSVDQIRKLYFTLIEKYPRLAANIFGEKTKAPVCVNCYEAREFNILRNCESCTYASFYKYEQEDMVIDYALKHDCFKCKYYDNCNLGCSLFFHSFKLKDDYKGCIKKEIYEYIDNNGIKLD